MAIGPPAGRTIHPQRDGLRSAGAVADGPRFVHSDPEHRLLYGCWFGERRAPATFLEASAEALAEWMRQDPEGPFADGVDSWPEKPENFDDFLQWQERVDMVSGSASRWRRWGFAEDWHQPILKADWHALPRLAKEAELFVPRYGWSEPMECSPPRIMYFLEALRNANRGCWHSVVESLEDLKRNHPTLAEEWAAEVVDSISDCFRHERLFAVVEAQVWWGPGDMHNSSHVDGVASLLHLGLTLGGRRVMRVGCFASADAEADQEEDEWGTTVRSGNNVWNAEDWKGGALWDVSMSLGSAYISSPFVFEHGVLFEACTHADPVITLQCRLAFDRDIGSDVNHLRCDAMNEIVRTIVESLNSSVSRGELRMPTMQEIIDAEARLGWDGEDVD